MIWQVLVTNRFHRSYKRLSMPIARSIDQAVDRIVENPYIGEKKKGDLSHIWVYKIRHAGQLYLLGYSLDKEIRIIYLEEVGSHENFYRNLKN